MVALSSADVRQGEEGRVKLAKEIQAFEKLQCG